MPGRCQCWTCHAHSLGGVTPWRLCGVPMAVWFCSLMLPLIPLEASDPRVAPLQPNEYIKTLADMKVTLKELCWLLRDERQGLTELQQQFAKAKATWETERAELKSHTAQVSLLTVESAAYPLPLAAKPSAVRSWSMMSEPCS